MNFSTTLEEVMLKDKLRGYKTVVFNVLMGLTGLLAALGVDGLPGEMALADILDKVEVVFVSVWCLVNLYLRKITTSPIFNK